MSAIKLIGTEIIRLKPNAKLKERIKRMENNFRVTNKMPEIDFIRLCANICMCAYEHIAYDLEEALKNEDSEFGWKQLHLVSYALSCLLAQRFEISVDTAEPFEAFKMDEPLGYLDRTILITKWIAAVEAYRSAAAKQEAIDD